MDFLRIDDPADARVAAYLDIRERDLVGRQGRFIAEGKVVLDALLASRHFEVESVLLLENRLSGLSPVLAKVPDAVPVFIASSKVIDRIAGFPMHRGILAVGRRNDLPDARILLRSLPEKASVLVLVGIANHDNVGAIFRNAAAFGVDAVFLDATCCDPLYRKAIRVSVGAALRVPFAIVQDLPDFDRQLSASGFGRYALSPRGEAEIRDLGRQERTALYLGTEGEGLPESVMASMPTVSIAMVPGFDSLNVAAASAIALHHFFVEGRKPGKVARLETL
jgi:tRNA G18 (ribose-2'-O)-methylase SpoU